MLAQGRCRAYPPRLCSLFRFLGAFCTVALIPHSEGLFADLAESNFSWVFPRA
jgi:hypothetical protein